MYSVPKRYALAYGFGAPARATELTVLPGRTVTIKNGTIQNVDIADGTFTEAKLASSVVTNPAEPIGSALSLLQTVRRRLVAAERRIR